MKLTALLFVAIMSMTTGYAQTSTGPQGAFLEQDQAHTLHNSNNNINSEFSNVEMSYEKDSISFSSLPELKKRVSVVITNTEGEEVTGGSITNQQTSVKIAKLQKGMYFVTLYYKGASRKGFVLHKE